MDASRTSIMMIIMLPANPFRIDNWELAQRQGVYICWVCVQRTLPEADPNPIHWPLKSLSSVDSACTKPHMNLQWRRAFPAAANSLSGALCKSLDGGPNFC